ncbi:MAG: hypothetical protein KGH72_04580 [Candidatus Micrarchaeota archaeon]|nr:hypothetical protein [Candidatus Micrarchaeota archaeon]
MRRGGFFPVRKVVALDIYLHGYTFILLEFGLGTPLLFLFGFWTMSYSNLLGLYLITLGLNYLPLLLYAVDMKLKGSAMNEGKSEVSRNREYSIRQFILFIPLSTLLLAVHQELGRG